MRKVSAACKWLCIVGAVLLLAGVVVFACGMSAADWDFSKLETVRYAERTYAQGEETIGAVELDLRSADIEVCVSAEAEGISLAYPVVEGKEENTALTVQDGTLRVAEQSGGASLFSWQFSAPVARLTLPEGAELALSLKTDSGDIGVRGAACASLNVQTDNGNISLQDVTCAGDLQARTHNGNIGGTGDIAAASARLQTDAGNIRLGEGVLRADSAELRSAVGDIRATLAGSAADYTVVAETDVGSSDIESGGTGEKTLTVSTDVGNISISFEA